MKECKQLLLKINPQTQFSEFIAVEEGKAELGPTTTLHNTSRTLKFR